MFGKIIALIAALAVVAIAEPCGYLSTGITGYGLGGCRSRVLNVGCSLPVVSATPSCAVVATPTAVVDPIPTVAVSSGVCGSVLYGSGVYGSGLYGSGVCGGCGSEICGCGTAILPSVC